ncbi:MAG: tRNA (cytidine(34)-2'-O)-methyltransferase [Alphaproteobacteria bacterium]|nr:tRNA (cytidine(34)-2'-O)-methyltransferase [Alphaproteobacteria bacterium]
MRLVLYQPDIPQNAGTLLRLAACMDVGVDIVEPCGFLFSDRHFRRAGLDYLPEAALIRHQSWAAYRATQPAVRLIALSAHADTPYTSFHFRPDDALLLGQESTGLPPEVEDVSHARLRIPMRAGLRSLNVAVAAAMVLGEALRQTDGWPA